MIKLELTTKQAKQYARMLASHNRLVITCPLGDLFEIVNKPSRKGEMFGNAKGKQPLYEERQAFKGKLLLKKMITDFKETLV